MAEALRDDWTGPRTLTELRLLFGNDAQKMAQYVDAQDVPPMLRWEFEDWAADEAESKHVDVLDIKGDLPGHQFHGNQYTTWTQEDEEYSKLTPKQQDDYDKLILQKSGFSHITAMHVAQMPGGAIDHNVNRWQADNPKQLALLEKLAQRPGSGRRTLADGSPSGDTVETQFPIAPKGTQEDLTKEIRQRLDDHDLVAKREMVDLTKVTATEQYLSRNSLATIIRVLDQGPKSPKYRPGYEAYMVRKDGQMYIYDSHHRAEAHIHSGEFEMPAIVIDLDQHKR